MICWWRGFLIKNGVKQVLVSITQNGSFPGGSGCNLSILYLNLVLLGASLSSATQSIRLIFCKSCKLVGRIYGKIHFYLAYCEPVFCRQAIFGYCTGTRNSKGRL